MTSLVLFGGVVSLSYSIWVAFTWRRVRGTVVGYDSKASDGGQVFHRPVLSFQLENGKRTEATSTMGWWRRKLRVGAEVTLRYHPSDTKRIEIQTLGDMLSISATFFVLGGIFATVLYFQLFAMN